MNRNRATRIGKGLSLTICFLLFLCCISPLSLLYAEFYNLKMPLVVANVIFRSSQDGKQTERLNTDYAFRMSSRASNRVGNQSNGVNSVMDNSRQQRLSTRFPLVRRNRTEVSPFLAELPSCLNDTSASSGIEILRTKLIQMKKQIRFGNVTAAEMKRYKMLYRRYQLLTGQKDIFHPYPALREIPLEPESNAYFEATYYYPFQEYRLLYNKP